MLSRLVIITVIILSLTSCGSDADPADTIYQNGSIISMTGADDVYEALAIKNGKIQAIGNATEINKLKGSTTKVVDLKGQTLLPGFIDAHSHVMMGAQLVDYVNVSSPPVAGVNNINDIINKLKKKKADDNIEKGEWIIGWGYDPDLLDEGRHPNKFDLDKDFPDNPVYLNHVSGHLSTMNSRALELVGYTSETPNPAGGEIYRVNNSTEPTGLISETAMAQAREALPRTGNAKRRNYNALFGMP